MGKDFCFTEIVRNFNFKGEYLGSNVHDCGHINDTFIVNYKDESGEECKYVLQRINTDVFTNPDELMKNIKNVTSHIAKKVDNPLRETLNVIPTKDGKLYHTTSNGECWRAYVYIVGAKTYDMVEKPEHLYTTGKALGNFQKQLSDFPVETLHETIKDFHNTAKRYEDFVQAVKEDKLNRVSEVQDDIDFVMTRAEDTRLVVDLIKQGKLPLRVTHNDTKFNNIMIDDETEEGIAVIDLDTVMPGVSLYDFGDCIRSSANTAEEDEKDLSKVSFDLNLFEYFTKGYLEAVGDSLTKEEIEYLPFSVKLLAIELGMRFLMDHINGDVYFKIHRENHNLDRARCQFRLAYDVEEKIPAMKKIIEKYI